MLCSLCASSSTRFGGTQQVFVSSPRPLCLYESLATEEGLHRFFDLCGRKRNNLFSAFPECKSGYIFICNYICQFIYS